jgi:hypothetical protein
MEFNNNWWSMEFNNNSWSMVYNNTTTINWSSVTLYTTINWSSVTLYTTINWSSVTLYTTINWTYIHSVVVLNNKKCSRKEIETKVRFYENCDKLSLLTNKVAYILM